MQDRRSLCFGLLTSLAVVLAGLPAAAQVTVAQVEQATTVKQFLALGAHKLTADEFKSKVVGKPMTGEGWSWIIDSDGATSSEAFDGSWKEVAQPWSMKGDKYCTAIDGKRVCRNVYMIGAYMRMSDKTSDTALASWTAKVK